MNGAPASGTVTVLFTDVVGSTELLTRLGEEPFNELRRAHFAALREQLAVAGGTEVKTLGDGLLATFSSAPAAVAGAVAMQQAAERQSRTAGVPFTIRVGLALGEVTFEEGDVFGTPVVEAARLVGVARPGQILATSVVRMVAGRSGPAFTDVGALELKGLAEPVPACEIAWAPPSTSAERLPLPPSLASPGRIFVGRDAEVERLTQRWKEAQAGEARLVLVGGEPGIGKTRLAAELAHRLYGDGGLVLAGRCDEDLGVPYQPFVDALRHFVDHTPADELRRGLGRYRGELVRLLPELPDRIADLPAPLRSDPETERYRLFDAVAAWLAEVSAEAPVLLVLDDLQWAAKPTLLLLRHVLRFPERLRLLVVATYRDSDIGRGHPLTELLDDVRRQPGLERLGLSGLDGAGVVAFVAQAAGELTEQQEVLARVIWDETEGNPFFVAEVLRHLAETGGVERRQGRWQMTVPVEELGIPEGIRGVVGRRLSRLPDVANRVLALAAVVGLEFETAVLQAAGDFADDDLLSALEEAEAARLLIEVPGPVSRYEFTHSLVRATLYDELSSARRVLFHKKVAEAIETLHAGRLDDHLPALAHHYARASAPAARTAKAIEYARRAGDRALSQLAHDEAVAYYRSALDLLDVADATPDEPVRLELLVSLGEAERRAGEPMCRETLLAAARLARELGDAGTLARAALANLRGNLYSAAGVVDSDRVEMLDAALTAVGEGDSPTRARLLASIAQELVFSGDADRCRRLSDDGLAMARRLGDPAVVAAVLVARYHTICGPDTLPERRADTAELLTLSERIGDPSLRSRGLWIAYRSAVESADLESADRYLEANDRLTAELGQPTLRWAYCWDRDGRVLLGGRVDEADRLVREAFELGRATGQPDADLFLAAQLFQVRFEQGRLEEVEELLSEAAAQAPGMPALRAMQALLASELERLDDARARFEELAREDFADVPFDVYWLRTLTDAAAVCARLGDTGRAAVLARLLAPYGDQLVVAIRLVSGSVAHYRGMLAATLGRFDEAEFHFEAAEATHIRIGAPTWLARTRLERARLLLRRELPGDGERARELLATVRSTAAELGLRNVERQAAALLATVR
jgi:class 3 adenylate cyclase/tetratricopeptide (TPR) repeat protein